MTHLRPFPIEVAEPVRRIDDHTLAREVVVKPGMCGHNALLITRIGDWTWESVALLCELDVFGAADCTGAPTYLSFADYEVLADANFHLRTPTFGDRLQVVSACYRLGSESLLTLHRLALADRSLPERLSLEEFHSARHDHCLYAQNVNRWIRRGGACNSDLVSGRPAGLDASHLPPVSPDLSPRGAYDEARRRLRLPGGAAFRHDQDWTIAYELDPARDFNGVGLLFFASYFAIMDSTLARLWRRLGRTDASFLARAALKTRICYLGNADVGDTLDLSISRSTGGGRERFDVRMMEARSGRPVAIAAAEFEVPDVDA